MTISEDPRIAAGMRRQTALRRERLEAGASIIGWKVGFGAPAALAKLGLAGPLVGFLLDSAQLPSGATVALSTAQMSNMNPSPRIGSKTVATSIRLVIGSSKQCCGR